MSRGFMKIYCVLIRMTFIQSIVLSAKQGIIVTSKERVFNLQIWQDLLNMTRFVLHRTHAYNIITQHSQGNSAKVLWSNPSTGFLLLLRCGN